MTPRHHVQSTRSSVVTCDLPMWRGGLTEEDEVRCVYCNHLTDDHYDPDRWDLSFETFKNKFDRMNIADVYGFPKGHPHTILNGDIVERKICLHICPMCGWWVAEDRAVLPALRWQHWALTLAATPVLEELALNDIAPPLKEVRRYLTRSFQKRASMHPRLFELTVASVFEDFGYEAVVTAYSNDGGIDVVLRADSGERVGVQVKRQRNTIEVEQIRAFLGALILSGLRRGVFISSSRFSKGAVLAARNASEVALPIELIDSERFFDMLGYAQLTRSPSPDECIDRAKKLKFHACVCYHLNTL